MKNNILCILVTLLFLAASASGAWVKIDDTDGSISYTGWISWAGENEAYQGTVHWTDTSGAVASYTFNGTGIRLYGFTESSAGTADVAVDGGGSTSVNYSQSGENGDVLLYEATELISGSHIITVTQSSGEIYVDAFQYDDGSAPDTDPPTPDPMTFSSDPITNSNNTISMTASTAFDSSGVEYYFDETSGNTGGTDSGWQDSTSYTDYGLESCTTYTYRVKARDKSGSQNQTAYSATEAETTGMDYVPTPAMQWHKGAGTSYGNHPHEGMQTSDGGYIAIGQTWDSSDEPEMLVVKTDSSGNEDWQKVIGTSSQPDIGICVAEVSDGFICGGGLYSGGNTKPALVKLNKSTGNIVSGWPKYYSGSQNCCIRGIDILDDGSIVTTGYVNSPQPGFLFICDDGEGFIMKTDSSGNLQWSKTLSVPQGTKVREISDGFAVASCAWFFDTTDHMDGVLIKTDSSGNETELYRYGGLGTTDFLYDFDLTSDGGYILGGHTVSYGAVNWDYWLVKVNSDFVEEWHKIFGQPRGYDANYIRDEGYGVRQTTDGGYIIGGGSGDESEYSGCGHPSGCSDEWKAYLVKTDSSGNVEWEGVYPSTSVGNTACEYVGLTSDGGYISFNDTDAFYGSVGSFAFGFLKVASDDTNSVDYLCPEGVDFIDYSFFADYWMNTACGDCGGADLTGDGNVDANDLDIFTDNWLYGK